jgi:putative transposase
VFLGTFGLPIKLHDGLVIIYPFASLPFAILSLSGEERNGHTTPFLFYCCIDYVQMLEHYRINISMTEKGDPYENAIAERVNGILKTEFLLNRTFATFDEAAAAVDMAIDKYNHVRPHASCNYLTPAMAHEQSGLLKKRWKKKIYTNTPVVPAGGLHIMNK